MPLSMNPYDKENSRPNFWLSCILLNEDCSIEPEELRLFLDQYNVEARPIWKPMHLQPVFRDRDFVTAEDGQDVGREIFQRGLCLPSDIKMTKEVQDEVIEMVRVFVKG